MLLLPNAVIPRNLPKVDPTVFVTTVRVTRSPTNEELLAYLDKSDMVEEQDRMHRTASCRFNSNTMFSANIVIWKRCNE